MLMILSFATSASAAGVRFYKDGNFRGDSFKHGAGDHWNSGQFYTVGNDNISSVYIDPGYMVILYQHANFKGSSRVLTHSATTLGNFNDKTSSMKILKVAARGAYVASFYQHSNFRGAKVKLRVGSYDSPKYFGGLGGRDITSLIIKPGYKALLYNHTRYRGSVTEVSGRITSLSSRAFNDKTASMIIVKNN